MGYNAAMDFAHTWRRHLKCSFTDRQAADNILLNSSNTADDWRRLWKAYSTGDRQVYVNTAVQINNERWIRRQDHAHPIVSVFRRNWDTFLIKYRALLERPGLVESVERMLQCGNAENGFLYCECPNCRRSFIIPFTCKSRFCPKCGNKQRERISNSVGFALVDAPHRQMVFSVPPDLRGHFRGRHRDGLLNLLFSTVNETLRSLLERKAPRATEEEHRRLGYVMFLHTYGRALNWHPHIHLLVAERYMSDDGRLRRFSFFPFEYLRRTFLHRLLRNMYHYIKGHDGKKEAAKFYRLWRMVAAKYPKGYYMYGPRMEDADTGDSRGDNRRIRGTRAVVQYVARYASHPAMAESRILRYDELLERIEWIYEPHEDDGKPEGERIGTVRVVDTAEDFIKKLIVHIPTRNFKTVRYYGFYAHAAKNRPCAAQRMRNAGERPGADLMATYEGMLLGNFGYTPFVCCCGHRILVDYGRSYIKGRLYGFT